MLDKIFTAAFAAANSAIFEVGAIMAVLMLLFGILEYRRGNQLREFIIKRSLDKPLLMTALSLIPVDGTLLFQYTAYRKKAIRPGSLLAGIIGIGEESTYLVLSYQPFSWLLLAGIKLLVASVAGSIVNYRSDRTGFADTWHKQDQVLSTNEAAVEADENFHELPDKFRHKLHHLRYHQIGKSFWIMFVTALLMQIVLKLLSSWFEVPVDSYSAMGIPIISWLAMIGIIVVFAYRLMIRAITREFGKIFEDEFEDTGDAVGDLAEVCSGVILIIFVLSFVINIIIGIAGVDRLAALFSGREIFTVLSAALIGMIPGTGASLAFTTLYFSLSSTQSALPFASLAACSIALIGDAQLVGSRQIKYSQRRLHLISLLLAVITGLLILLIETVVRN